MFFSKIGFLLLFIPLAGYVAWYILRGRHLVPSIKVSTALPYAAGVKSYKNYLIHTPFILRVLALSMLIFILARPQSSNRWQNTEVEGIDIMLAMDVSTSMLAMDLQPNRLEAAKQVAAEFVNARPNDNIGLTIFAGESFTQCPLTIDHTVMLNMLNSVKCDIAAEGIIEDGTAVGMGIANAITRLKDSKAKSKVIILLTDGSNNMGEISPEAAAEIAKQFGIRVYTVGVGTNAEAAPYPYMGQIVKVPVEIDEQTLEKIATITDGNYYRATSNSKLKEVYEQIDKLERTKMSVKEFSTREEEYLVFAIIAFVAILFEILLRSTILKRIP
ncbi:MAG: VWA domain-containing protein [Bacteroidaceae bacterium]|nr:VWA domain-containing protein [Bacteroidaceae bacterium]